MIEIEDILERWRDSKDALRPLHDSMENYFNLWRLKPYVPPDGTYEAYTSNKPRTLANKIMSMLASSTINISVLIDKQTGTNIKKSGEVERFIHGSLYQNDKRLRYRMQPKLLYQLIWYGCVYGWWGIMPLVVKGEDGQTNIVIRPIDPRWLYYEIGKDGPIWTASMRFTTQRALEEEYKQDIPKPAHGENLAVLDYWDDEANAVILSQDMSGESITGELLKKPTEHEIGHNPTKFGPVGMTPYITVSGNDETIAETGESVFSPNRTIYEPLNRILSYTMDMVALNIKQGYKVFNMTAEQAKQMQDLNRKGTNVVLDATQGQDIVPLNKDRMPADTGPLLGTIGGDEQQGGLSKIAWGETAGQVSGYLASQLNRSTEDVLVVRNSALEDCYLTISEELVQQYSAGGFEPINLAGYDNTGKAFMGSTIKPDDIEGDWFYEVSIKPNLPQDEMMRYQMAKLAHDEGFLSMLSIRDKLLHIQDPELEDYKVLEEKSSMIPPIGLGKIVEAMVERGKIKEGEAQEWYDMLMMMIGGGGQPPPQPQQPSGPGLGGPPPGIPPTQPTQPEMMGTPPMNQPMSMGPEPGMMGPG